MRRALPFVVFAVAACADPSRVSSVAGTKPLFDASNSDGSDNGVMCVQNTQLRPENEVPPTASEAKGHTQIKIRNDGTLEYKTFILNKAGETFVAGHIHRAPEGVNGPVIVPLFGGPPTNAEHIRQRGEVPVAAPLAADICNNPSNYYVNYHTTRYPGGAIRGQLE